MTPGRISSLAAMALASAGLAACGSSKSAPSFPRAGNGTLERLRKSLPSGLTLAPTGEVFKSGTSRFGFILLDSQRNQVIGGRVGVYTANARGADVRGPFFAQSLSLAVAPQFQSKTVASDPAAAKVLYVAHVPFPKEAARVLAIAQVGKRLAASTELQLPVDQKGGPPDVGQPAIRVHTPTVASVHGDIAKIDTRTPHDDMHQVDLYNALGHEPVVLVFATPEFCQSRVCGPIVDELVQAEQRFRGQAAFIHMEIYNNNNPAKGHRSQVLAWRLPTEPWLFTINRRGRIAARIEGAASLSEIDHAIQKAL